MSYTWKGNIKSANAYGEAESKILRCWDLNAINSDCINTECSNTTLPIPKSEHDTSAHSTLT